MGKERERPLTRTLRWIPSQVRFVLKVLSCRCSSHSASERSNDRCCGQQSLDCQKLIGSNQLEAALANGVVASMAASHCKDRHDFSKSIGIPRRVFRTDSIELWIWRYQPVPHLLPRLEDSECGLIQRRKALLVRATELAAHWCHTSSQAFSSTEAWLCRLDGFAAVAVLCAVEVEGAKRPYSFSGVVPQTVGTSPRRGLDS